MNDDARKGKETTEIDKKGKSVRKRKRETGYGRGRSLESPSRKQDACLPG
jgi:hypothetical protein